MQLILPYLSHVSEKTEHFFSMIKSVIKFMPAWGSSLLNFTGNTSRYSSIVYVHVYGVYKYRA